jgi:hypothetical protein
LLNRALLACLRSDFLFLHHSLNAFRNLVIKGLYLYSQVSLQWVHDKPLKKQIPLENQFFPFPIPGHCNFSRFREKRGRWSQNAMGASQGTEKVTF